MFEIKSFEKLIQKLKLGLYFWSAK